MCSPRLVPYFHDDLPERHVFPKEWGGRPSKLLNILPLGKSGKRALVSCWDCAPPPAPPRFLPSRRCLWFWLHVCDGLGKSQKGVRNHGPQVARLWRGKGRGAGLVEASHFHAFFRGR